MEPSNLPPPLNPPALPLPIIADLIITIKTKQKLNRIITQGVFEPSFFFFETMFQNHFNPLFF